jgi:hypothetical protein
VKWPKKSLADQFGIPVYIYTKVSPFIKNWRDTNIHTHEEMDQDILSAPLKVKQNLSSDTALQHGFNAAISQFIQIRGVEISSDK